MVKRAIARWHKYPTHEKAKAGLTEIEVPSPLSSAHEEEKSDLVKKHRGQFASDVQIPVTAPSEGSAMEGALQEQPEKKARKRRTTSAVPGDNLLRKRRKIASKRNIRKRDLV